MKLLVPGLSRLLARSLALVSISALLLAGMPVNLVSGAETAPASEVPVVDYSLDSLWNQSIDDSAPQIRPVLPGKSTATSTAQPGKAVKQSEKSASKPEKNTAQTDKAAKVKPVQAKTPTTPATTKTSAISNAQPSAKQAETKQPKLEAVEAKKPSQPKQPPEQAANTVKPVTPSVEASATAEQQKPIERKHEKKRPPERPTVPPVKQQPSPEITATPAKTEEQTATSQTGLLTPKQSADLPAVPKKNKPTPVEKVEKNEPSKPQTTQKTETVKVEAKTADLKHAPEKVKAKESRKQRRKKHTWEPFVVTNPTGEPLSVPPTVTASEASPSEAQAAKPVESSKPIAEKAQRKKQKASKAASPDKQPVSDLSTAAKPAASAVTTMSPAPSISAPKPSVTTEKQRMQNPEKAPRQTKPELTQDRNTQTKEQAAVKPNAEKVQQPQAETKASVNAEQKAKPEKVKKPKKEKKRKTPQAVQEKSTSPEVTVPNSVQEQSTASVAGESAKQESLASGTTEKPKKQAKEAKPAPKHQEKSARKPDVKKATPAPQVKSIESQGSATSQAPESGKTDLTQPETVQQTKPAKPFPEKHAKKRKEKPKKAKEKTEKVKAESPQPVGQSSSKQKSPEESPKEAAFKSTGTDEKQHQQEPALTGESATQANSSLNPSSPEQAEQSSTIKPEGEPNPFPWKDKPSRQAKIEKAEKTEKADKAKAAAKEAKVKEAKQEEKRKKEEKRRQEKLQQEKLQKENLQREKEKEKQAAEQRKKERPEPVKSEQVQKKTPVQTSPASPVQTSKKAPQQPQKLPAPPSLKVEEPTPEITKPLKITETKPEPPPADSTQVSAGTKPEQLSAESKPEAKQQSPQKAPQTKTSKPKTSRKEKRKRKEKPVQPDTGAKSVQPDSKPDQSISGQSLKEKQQKADSVPATIPAPEAKTAVPSTSRPPEQSPKADLLDKTPRKAPEPLSSSVPPAKQDITAKSIASLAPSAAAITPAVKPAEITPLATAQTLAGQYLALLTRWQQSKHKESLEPILNKGQEAAVAILKVAEELDEETFDAIGKKMPGYLMIRDDVLVVGPDPAFFQTIARQKGKPVDVAFFDLMSKTLNGYWPSTMEQLGDLSGCSRFGTGELVQLYGGWTTFKKQHPNAYKTALQDSNLLLLHDIEDQLLNSASACEGPDAVIEELQNFVTLYPKSELTPRIQKRLEAVRQGKADMSYKQGVKYQYGNQ